MKSSTKSGKCVFFDRDGIVNRSPGPGWVERWEDFHLLPEFVTAAKTALALGYEVAIITNQRGVALGQLALKTLEDMHTKLREELMGRGIRLLGIYTCPHERDTCNCRKPQPGLLFQAASEHALDMEASWMIGDKESDVEAGQLAGCKTILVSATAESTNADYRVSSMMELNVALADWLHE